MLFNVKNIIFPPKCLCCDNSVGAVGEICNECFNDIDFIAEPSCNICSEPFPYEMGDVVFDSKGFCSFCKKPKPKYDKMKSLFLYGKKSSEIIKNLKFYDQTFVGKYVTKLFSTLLVDVIDQIDFIIPVPLHKKRLHERRYNQSAILAKYIGKNILFGEKKNNLKLDFLVRKIHTSPQTSLPFKKRQKNVRNIFSIHKKYTKNQALYKGRNFLLVDDVVTTGSTLNECAKTLKNFGADKVFVATLAKTPLRL